MASLNKCLFIGNAGANPEVRSFENGNKIATVRIAVTERYNDRNGQQQENTEWIPLVFNGKLADIAAQFITKGSPVYVDGRWRTRKWTDQQGVEHFQTELRVETLQLLGQRPQQQAQAQTQAPAPVQRQQYQQAPAYPQRGAGAPVPPPRQYQQAPPAQQVYPQYAPQRQNPNNDLPPDNIDPDLGF